MSVNGKTTIAVSRDVHTLLGDVKREYEQAHVANGREGVVSNSEVLGAALRAWQDIYTPPAKCDGPAS